MTVKDPLLVICPCYNEERSIASLIDALGTAAIDADITVAVVDDASLDETVKEARSRNAICLNLPFNLGIGGAVQTGIKYAKQEGFGFCIQLDGDGQHPPSEIQSLLNKQRSSNADIVIGSRYIEGNGFQSTVARKFGARVIARTMSLLFPGLVVTDPTSGMRLMNHKAIDLFHRHYPVDFPEPVSLVWAHRNGLRIVEVPVEMKRREHGQSSIVGIQPVLYMVRVLSYILLSRLRAK